MMDAICNQPNEIRCTNCHLAFSVAVGPSGSLGGSIAEFIQCPHCGKTLELYYVPAAFEGAP